MASEQPGPSTTTRGQKRRRADSNISVSSIDTDTDSDSDLNILHNPTISRARQLYNSLPFWPATDATDAPNREQRKSVTQDDVLAAVGPVFGDKDRYKRKYKRAKKMVQESKAELEILRGQLRDVRQRNAGLVAWGDNVKTVLDIAGFDALAGGDAAATAAPVNGGGDGSA